MKYYIIQRNWRNIWEPVATRKSLAKVVYYIDKDITAHAMQDNEIHYLIVEHDIEENSDFPIKIIDTKTKFDEFAKQVMNEAKEKKKVKSRIEG